MNSKPSCIRHIQEWGAIAVPLTAPIDQTHKDTNTQAINDALSELADENGGELHFGPGVYVTNGPVGFNVTEDTSVGITIRGCGMFPTMIWSLKMDEPCLRFHTTTGNIRAIIMENITLRGGRHNLSLHKAAYNRFDNVVFWGGRSHFNGALVHTEWGVHSWLGTQNQFNHCWFYETGASNTDSALLWSSRYETLNDCTYGENGGGVVNLHGDMAINGGTGYGAWYRGNSGHNWLESDRDGNPGIDEHDPAFFSTIGGEASINGLVLGLGKVFITAKSAYRLLVTGCRVKSGSSPATPPGDDFKGFINVTANPNDSRLALVVNGNSFHVRSNQAGGDTGYLIQQPGNVPFKDCVVANNIFSSNPGATIVPLATSALSLLEPANENIVSNATKVNQP